MNVLHVEDLNVRAILAHVFEQLSCSEPQIIIITSGSVSKPENEKIYLPPIPKECDGYNAVREYIAERKKYDEDFRIYWECHNLKQNCVYLTREFGWIVDDHSLGTNLNRHR